MERRLPSQQKAKEGQLWGEGVLVEGVGVQEGAEEGLGAESQRVCLSRTGTGLPLGWLVLQPWAPWGALAQGPHPGRFGTQGGCGSWEVVGVDWGLF